MSEKKVAIHGLSIVDATTNDSSPTGECKPRAVNDDELVVKIDASTADHDDGLEELSGDSFLDEADEKINLFDVLDHKEETENGNKNPLQNSTLIITTEEQLDTTVCDDTFNNSTETLKNFKDESANAESNFEEPKKTLNKSRSRNEDQGYFWVSNIGRQVKATNLKKFFSQIGKVLTAKVLTNGKNYYGYVSVDSGETAAKCIRQLNGTVFDSKRITVSKERPDLRETRSALKVEPRKRRSEKFELKESKSAESKVAMEERRVPKKTNEENFITSDAIAELNKKLDKFKAEINRYKYKVLEYQRRHEGMRKKCDNLEKELKSVQYQMRADRRRLNQDREHFEKSKKLELVRLESDKTLVSKELGEVKKLREHLKAKIDELNAQSKKVPKRRVVRSPPSTERSRSPRGRSPPMRIGSRITYRPDERLEKKRKRDDPPPVHGRTPPPPPKLTNGIGKKRGDNLPHRQYFEEFQKKSSLERGHGFEYRHKPSFPPAQELSRPPWQAPYSKDPRRINAVPTSGSQSYPSDPRYGGGYQFPPSSITVPPRSYYPEFGKPYGHY